MGKKDKFWWKHGVIYHIYLRSFLDSNGDGIGDLKGVTQKLDYIRDMGFSGIWLSPFFKSPMVDFGYDISDYMSVDPQYGNLQDIKTLITEAHKRDISIILDIALNHTSDKHPWFVKSRSSKNNKKRDWYIWKKGRLFGTPNNWITGLFESVWEFDKSTQEYFLHSFLKHQPDLNWRNKAVKKEFIRIFKFWMDLGIDGFRLDMINWLIKDKKLRNNPSILPFKIFQRQIYNKNRMRVSSILQLIRKTVEKYPGRVTVGEVFTMPPGDPELSAFFMGNGKDSLHMAFDFSLLYRFWNAKLIFKTVSKWINVIPEKAWPAHVLSNHDQRRSFSRLCRGKRGIEKAKVLAALLLTLPGTPFVYYGEEIGMKNYKLKKSQILDPLGKKFWPFFKGRDSSRTPMQWNNSKNGGFSASNITWLPVNPDYKNSNVEAQLKNPDSLLNFYRNLIFLRKKEKAFYVPGKSFGPNPGWEICEDGKHGVIAYFRRSKKTTILVVMNFKTKVVSIKNPAKNNLRVILSTHYDKEITLIDASIITMKPLEVSIYKMSTK